MTKKDLPISIHYYAGKRTQAVCFSIGSVNVYFSYETVIAIQSPVSGLHISKNYWGPTTGRHMNKIKFTVDKDRMPRDEFEAKLLEVLAHYGLAEISPVDKTLAI